MKQSKHLRRQVEYFEDELSYFRDYEKSLNAWRRAYIERIKDNFFKGNYTDKVLLDVGTGSGYVAIEFSRLGLKVIATDIISSALKNIEKYKTKFKLKSLKTVLSTAEKIPLKSKSVDFIVANSVLEHIEDETEAISELKRVLKKNGKIFLTVPLKYKYIWPFLWPLNYIHDRKLGHLHRYDITDLKRKFRGLTLENTYYTGHLLKVIWVIISRILMGGMKKSSKLDYVFEKIDNKLKGIRYGASNLVVVFKNK